MEFESEVDALICVALEEHAKGHRRFIGKKDGNLDLAVKRFQSEYPTEESKQAYIDTFWIRAASHPTIKSSKNQRVESALRFWFEVIWPNLVSIRQSQAYQDFFEISTTPRYSPGQLIRHSRFGYRGVVVDVDLCFEGTEQWYEAVARSRPPKNRPWYHILVHDSDQTTYVAERHLEHDSSHTPIKHPLVEQFFDGFQDGEYN